MRYMRTLYTNSTNSFNGHYIYDSALLYVPFSCLQYDVFPRCTNLCGGHLSIKGKVSLFAVSLLSQTDQNRSEWQAGKQQEPNF